MIHIDGVYMKLRNLIKNNKININSNYTKSIIFLLSGCIMVAHGGRMIYQGLCCKGSYYIPGLFDIIFDWLTLLFLGIIILYYAFVSIYKTDAKKV